MCTKFDMELTWSFNPRGKVTGAGNVEIQRLCRIPASTSKSSHRILWVTSIFLKPNRNCVIILLQIKIYPTLLVIDYSYALIH